LNRWGEGNSEDKTSDERRVGDYRRRGRSLRESEEERTLRTRKRGGRVILLSSQTPSKEEKLEKSKKGEFLKFNWGQKRPWYCRGRG